MTTPDGDSRRSNRKQLVLQRCALTGVSALPTDLLCFVCDPAGMVLFDIKQNLPVQQKLWLAPKRHVVQQACESNVFAQLADTVICPPDLPERVNKIMMRRLQETLNLLRRSGNLIGGFEKVKATLVQNKAAALVQAGDASPDGREKLAKLAAHHNIPVITLLKRETLAEITTQDNQVHLAVLYGGLATVFIEESARLSAYENLSQDSK
ncbi:MAG: ribosomal L7Ae/L30e/S12e/Gadd45 family protein [Alphaproteobacteria bacterium]|nr:ribosomal L7Ae/L30e/S12e/Gadd45 family protein [Alphaproteobacteria bacterium]